MPIGRRRDGQQVQSDFYVTLSLPPLRSRARRSFRGSRYVRKAHECCVSISSETYFSERDNAARTLILTRRNAASNSGLINIKYCLLVKVYPRARYHVYCNCLRYRETPISNFSHTTVLSLSKIQKFSIRRYKIKYYFSIENLIHRFKIH